MALKKESPFIFGKHNSVLTREGNELLVQGDTWLNSPLEPETLNLIINVMIISLPLSKELK